MDKTTASEAKQRFGDLLERAIASPVAIEKHGKIVAAMVPASWLGRAEVLDERKQARERQRRVELDRLMAHQRVGIELLSSPGRKKELLSVARREVRKWAELGLCSQDYIDRWGEWLSLPVPELVQQMCSDAGGWGNAMRQNSPFGVASR